VPAVVGDSVFVVVAIRSAFVVLLFVVVLDFVELRILWPVAPSQLLRAFLLHLPL
jgi:hypothetical protein